MNSEAIRAAIADHLYTGFSTAHPTVKIFFENQDFAQPQGAPWVYVTILDNMTVRANIGNDRQFKSLGVVNCQIQVPEGTGTRTARQLADTISGLLTDQRINVPGEGGLTFYGTEKRNRGMVGGWYSFSVQTEFRHWHSA